MSSKDLCTIHRLAEIVPYVDALKIEGRSKSELYVGAMVKAYKHVRDAILSGKTPDEVVVDLVNQVPHRPYRDGFLLKKMMEEIPDGEKENTSCHSHDSISLDSAGPLFARNYYGLITDETMEYE